MATLICKSFTAVPLEDGRIQITTSETANPRGDQTIKPNDRLDRKAVVELLQQSTGLQYSPNAIYTYSNRKHDPLPSHKVAGRRYYIAAEVQEWILRHDKPRYR